MFELGRALRRVRKRRFSPIQGGAEGIGQLVRLAAVVQFDVSSVLDADVTIPRQRGRPNPHRAR